MQSPERDQLLFFTSPQAYVLVFESESGEFSIATEGEPQDKAILLFLSLIDALIEVGQLAGLGNTYHVMPASDVDPTLFRDADGQGLIAYLHLGWPACDGHLLLRPKGQLARYGRTLHQPACEPLTFDVDPDSLVEVELIHEHGGLFAWRETLRNVMGWSGHRLAQSVEHALSSMRVTHEDASACNQFALFDPEFSQWHFVSRSDSEAA